MGVLKSLALFKTETDRYIKIYAHDILGGGGNIKHLILTAV